MRGALVHCRYGLVSLSAGALKIDSGASEHRFGDSVPNSAYLDPGVGVAPVLENGNYY